MQIQISGKHVAVGEALRTRVIPTICSPASANISNAAATPRWWSAATATASNRLRGDPGLRPAAAEPWSGRRRPRRLRPGAGQDRDPHPPLQATLKSHSIAADGQGRRDRRPPMCCARRRTDDGDDWDWTKARTPPAAMVIAETQAAAAGRMTVSMAVMELDLTEIKQSCLGTPPTGAYRWYTAAGRQHRLDRSGADQARTARAIRGVTKRSRGSLWSLPWRVPPALWAEIAVRAKRIDE